MRERSGLPIAAYLGLLVALALAAAFVAVIAVVIFLPPRPPDVMRADVVADHFSTGYEQALHNPNALPRDGMVWSIHRDAPKTDQTTPLEMMQAHLAQHLRLQPSQVRMGASQFARSDVFVFRVGDATVHSDHEVIISEHAVRVATPTPEAEAPRANVTLNDVEDTPAPEAPQTNYVFSYSSDGPPPPLAPPAPRARPPTPSTRVGVTPVTPVAPVAPIPPEPPRFAPAPPGVALISGFQVSAQLPDGRWLTMRQGRNWEELSWILRAVLVIGGTLLTLSLLAVLFARRLTRPIRNFSEAVQAVGVDPQSAAVVEEGPRELRGAARAVNTMQARLRALIADRTKTLAAVAHDMRTPLMRLRLQAENASPEQRDRMAKEIGEVEALVASFIAFARDDPAEEARVRLDLSALLQSLADDHAEHGRNVTFTGDERLIITGQSLGLRRLFGNLVDNALKYGASARINLRREENAVVVDVADDGPGVPPDQRESVFEPFVRLNEEGTRGAGLGLAAARSIARAHGGDIVILDAERGALLRVTLPA